MKARAAQRQLLSPVKVCIFFTLTFILIAFSMKAHAEYYLVYDYAAPEPAMVELYGGAPYYHHVRHHYTHHWVARHRNSYNIEVYYFLQPSCCGAGYAYAPVIPTEVAVPMRREYDSGNVVYMAQPDMYSGSQINTPNYGYDSDQRTGDDVAIGMDIDHY